MQPPGCGDNVFSPSFPLYKFIKGNPVKTIVPAPQRLCHRAPMDFGLNFWFFRKLSVSTFILVIFLINRARTKAFWNSRVKVTFSDMRVTDLMSHGEVLELSALELLDSELSDSELLD